MDSNFPHVESLLIKLLANLSTRRDNSMCMTNQTLCHVAWTSTQAVAFPFFILIKHHPVHLPDAYLHVFNYENQP